MGHVCGAILRDTGEDRTGLLVTIGTNNKSVDKWELIAVPLISLLSVAFNDKTLECKIEIEQRKVKIRYVFRNLPKPSLRRFLSPGPLQFVSVEPTDDQQETVWDEMKKVEKISQLCSRIMSLEKNRDVIRSGLEHTLTLLQRNKKTSIESSSSGSHARVIKIVPTTID